MATLKVIEYRDSLGNRRGWTVATLPRNREGDPLPTSHISDRYFGPRLKRPLNFNASRLRRWVGFRQPTNRAPTKIAPPIVKRPRSCWLKGRSALSQSGCPR